MKNQYFVFWIATALILTAAFNSVAADISAEEWNSLTQQAVSENTNVSSPAIAALRALGPAGLDALLKANAETLSQEYFGAPRADSPQQHAFRERLQSALSSVSGQRDCQVSRLFWHTDFEKAREAARASGKPILSLRLLGRLAEEFSCANSRFFRTTLYANAEVSQYLRDHFILHWKSVRPVPRITVDFGDGRKIERTITGNSIHYILDADGRTIDALPGLYGPQAFLKGLADAEKAALQCAALTAAAKVQYLRQYHNDRYAAVLQEWNSDLAAVGEPARESFQDVTDATWTRIAGLHAGDAQLDAASKALVQSKSAADAMRAAVSKTRVESPLVIELRNLQRSIAEDTVRNEYLLHSQIHQWLAGPFATLDVDSLNRKVYAELFLTPDSDPWLGLVPANVFTGLDRNGLVQTVTGH